MNCAECKLLGDRAAIALEEIQKLRDEIAETFRAGRIAEEALQLLAARERAYERCLAAIERHALSHQSGSRSFAPLHA
jgi:hypothetical protein